MSEAAIQSAMDALWDVIDTDRPAAICNLRETATAAITAYLAQREAEGFVMVPLEPTEGMISAGIAERHDQPCPEAWSLATANIYRAMLATITAPREEG